MSFQVRAQLEDRQSIERSPSQLIQTVQNAEPDGCTAAKPTRPRNLFDRRTEKWKASRSGAFEEKMRRLRTDRRPWFAFTPRNSDEIVNTQPYPEAIEARPKVGRPGRDAAFDLICAAYEREELLT